MTRRNICNNKLTVSARFQLVFCIDNRNEHVCIYVNSFYFIRLLNVIILALFKSEVKITINIK